MVMAAFNEDSRIVVPFKPTLFHMSLVKLAVQLHNEFRHSFLKQALSEIESGILAESEEYRSEMCQLLLRRAKERLLLIDSSLRKTVLSAVEGVESEVSTWMDFHRAKLTRSHAEPSFFWRSDGTIDRIKTAQEIILNQNMCIATCFDLACTYFLGGNVQHLWEDLEGSRKKEIALFSNSVPFTVSSWVRWMREGADVAWTRASREDTDSAAFLAQLKSLTGIFSSNILPEKMDVSCYILGLWTDDDLRFCLYSMTKEEQEEVMETRAADVLELHMNWPLARQFLETAEKSWRFLDGISFCRVLNSLLDRRHKTDFDFEHLAEEFWSRSPDHFKEIANIFLFSRNMIEFIEKRTMKGKTDSE